MRVADQVSHIPHVFLGQRGWFCRQRPASAVEMRDSLCPQTQEIDRLANELVRYVVDFILQTTNGWSTENGSTFVSSTNKPFRRFTLQQKRAAAQAEGRAVDLQNKVRFAASFLSRFNAAQLAKALEPDVLEDVYTARNLLNGLPARTLATPRIAQSHPSQEEDEKVDEPFTPSRSASTSPPGEEEDEKLDELFTPTPSVRTSPDITRGAKVGFLGYFNGILTLVEGKKPHPRITGRGDCPWIRRGHVIRGLVEEV